MWHLARGKITNYFTDTSKLVLHIQVHLSISGWTDCFLNAQSGSSKMMYYSNLFPVKWKKKKWVFL